MLITEEKLNPAQRLVYGRKRIIDALYEDDPDICRGFTLHDIAHIELNDERVFCHTLTGDLICIDRRKVLENFWKFYTRTPSYFDYKIWVSGMNGKLEKGSLPLAKLDYTPSLTKDALEKQIGRPPHVSTDKDGTKRIYFVNTEDSKCTCGAWNNLSVHKEELEKEFELFTNIKFKPICKHIQWQKANIKLKAAALKAKDITKGYNPRMCVYYYDQRRAKICYRVSYDFARTNPQWLPVRSWKEKNIYDAGGIPTGNCWETFMNALKRDDPFNLSLYSESLVARLNMSPRK